jgi:hypothetical protein
MHIYKIKKGKIYDIEAIGFTLPYGTKSGWEYNCGTFETSRARGKAF